MRPKRVFPAGINKTGPSDFFPGLSAKLRAIQDQREAEELADDVMPCGCCAGSCYCDDEAPQL